MSENEIKDTQNVTKDNTQTLNENSVKTQTKSSRKTTKKENKKIEELKKELEKMTEKYNELNDKYIRLAAEFDNYKKRTLKEKSDLLKYGGESVLTNLLPIIDDLERASASIQNSSDFDSIKQGIELINSKFGEFLKQQGLKEIEAKNLDFNTDFHEAITKTPAPTDDLKGKVIDVIQKGYMLHNKVIRFAKVVVGE